ncbi:Uncharacterized protein BP5553_08410 [Venustampulla echinocandica]|uniref:Zn(2)-C6 fungal-type domain-containing protein n=1 Tax=Venustampulla echinocandica TaxID=2656787 RepID=A0A370TE78_9HELO|nr:Uncharacterized protein BP5553_08410 [Venustampulla echinocandica]RDL32971.1 Uncharacterized protein BP5553_08410 [Venustampulla echinocandica]
MNFRAGDMGPNAGPETWLRSAGRVPRISGRWDGENRSVGLDYRTEAPTMGSVSTMISYGLWGMYFKYGLLGLGPIRAVPDAATLLVGSWIVSHAFPQSQSWRMFRYSSTGKPCFSVKKGDDCDKKFCPSASNVPRICIPEVDKEDDPGNFYDAWPGATASACRRGPILFDDKSQTVLGFNNNAQGGALQDLVCLPLELRSRARAESLLRVPVDRPPSMPFPMSQLPKRSKKGSRLESAHDPKMWSNSSFRDDSSSSHSQSQSQLFPSDQEQVRRPDLEFDPYSTAPGVVFGHSSQSQLQGRVGGGLGYQSAPASAIIKTESPVDQDGGSSYATITAIPPVMPGKRTASGEPTGNGNATPVKQPRAERPEEFSSVVKKKLQSSTRTGQACDRCKVRKIRCDGLPGGCSPCLQNNSECRTTDRITGRATSRGYVEGIEQQNRDLQQRVRELEQQLTNRYHDTGPGFGYSQAASTQAPAWGSAASTFTAQPASSLAKSLSETDLLRPLPAFRAGFPGDNYLGVSEGLSNLSSIKGTSLSILGMEIDIADFESPDMDEPDPSIFHPQLYNKSYQALLQSALNINPRLDKVELPAKDQAITYAEWFFRLINPYLPMLHKPSFMAILNRFYGDPTFRPKPSEIVIVHMVLAIMMFQYAVRNHEDPAHHTVQDVQALTLICSHLRNFPKPGASWILTQTTMSLAVEIGLHRSATSWVSNVAQNALDIDMRKRTFWSLLVIHVGLSGKLGRPLALRMEDIDVEMPEDVDDELLSENGLDTSRPGKCLHKIGLQAIRLIPLFVEMYSTIYAIRRQPEKYISTVNLLEAKLRAWKDSFPPELVRGESGQDEQEGRVFALYAQAWAYEFRLLLRHPSISMTDDAQFNAESMRICVESSRGLLGVVRQLQKLKSLDTTWGNCAVYVMAITTVLFAQWPKRTQISPADLLALREEMDMWLDIMGDIGALLGSRTRLREAVRVVTDGTLSLLSRGARTKGGLKQIGAPDNSNSPTDQSVLNPNNAYSKPLPYNFGKNPATSREATATTNYAPTENPLTHQQTRYPTATQYSTYPETVPPPSSLYAPHDNHSFPPFAASADEAPLLAAFAQQAPQIPPETWQKRDPHTPYSGSQAWQQWANTMAGSLEPQDCYSASALMQLGGNTQGDAPPSSSALRSDINTNAPSVIDHGQLGGHIPGDMSSHWPLNIFDVGHAGPSS